MTFRKEPENLNWESRRVRVCLENKLVKQNP